MIRRFVIYAVAVVAVFLLGFVPMWLTTRARTNERDAAQQELRLARIENSLATAAIQARRGDYDPARAAASTFYTDLRSELDRTDSAVPTQQRDELKALLGERDQMMALLVRSDPAAGERFAQTYISYQNAVEVAAIK